MTVLVTPTVPLARAWSEAKGARLGKGKADTQAAVLTFLRDNPAITRAQAQALGLTDGYGSRGLIGESVYEAVTVAVTGFDFIPEKAEAPDAPAVEGA